MKTRSFSIPALSLALLLCLVSTTRAFFDPTVGRFASRDPLNEPGRNVVAFNAFQQKLAKYQSARSAVLTAKLNEMRLISQLGETLPPIPFKPRRHLRADRNLQELQLYGFCFNSPIGRFDILGLDSPGCDGVPDALEGTCILECCAQHDKCYHDNRCSAFSWFSCPLTRCGRCNWRAVFCILGCVLTGPNTDDPSRPNYYCGVHDVFFDDPTSDHMSHTTNPP